MVVLDQGIITASLRSVRKNKKDCVGDLLNKCLEERKKERQKRKRKSGKRKEKREENKVVSTLWSFLYQSTLVFCN